MMRSFQIDPTRPYVISEEHSINRVKRSLERASGIRTPREARHWIACLKWLGRWGPAFKRSY